MRTFLQLDDLHDFVTERFGSDRRLVALDRLIGGTKKGVYRLRLDDGTTTILYVWADAENYWPPADSVADDPFTDATGVELFEVNHAALVAAGVRVPELFFLDRSTGLALVEDAGGQFLEGLLASDPAAAAAPLAELGESLRRMHTTRGPRYGKLAEIARGEASQTRLPEDVIEDRALRCLNWSAARDQRIADAHRRIGDHVRELRAAVPARQVYGLVHGELGPDHVLVTPAGEPVMIDFEGLTFFDVEWDHAWTQMRFGEAYPGLNPVEAEPARLAFYRYAQVLSLIESPLRIAATDFPDRDWMLDLAEWNIKKALAAL
ncbi:phosphotransferase family protein [Micromonosporaceae bacterium Da 78-11]